MDNRIKYIPHWMGSPKTKVTEDIYYEGKYIKEIEENINIEAFDYLASVRDVCLFYKEKDELWVIFASFLGRFTHDVDRRSNISREFLLCAREKDDTDKSLCVIATTLKLNEKINELRKKYSYLLESDNPPKEDDIYEMELVDNPVRGKLSKNLFKLEKPKKFYEEGIEWYIINPQLPEHILKIYKEVKNNKIVLLSEKEFGEWSEKWWYKRLSQKEIKPFLISSEIGKEESDDWEEEEWREYIEHFYNIDNFDKYEDYCHLMKTQNFDEFIEKFVELDDIILNIAFEEVERFGKKLDNIKSNIQPVTIDKFEKLKNKSPMVKGFLKELYGKSFPNWDFKETKWVWEKEYGPSENLKEEHFQTWIKQGMKTEDFMKNYYKNHPAFITLFEGTPDYWNEVTKNNLAGIQPLNPEYLKSKVSMIIEAYKAKNLEEGHFLTLLEKMNKNDFNWDAYFKLKELKLQKLEDILMEIFLQNYNAWSDKDIDEREVKWLWEKKGEEAVSFCIKNLGNFNTLLRYLYKNNITKGYSLILENWKVFPNSLFTIKDIEDITIKDIKDTLKSYYQHSQLKDDLYMEAISIVCEQTRDPVRVYKVIKKPDKKIVEILQEYKVEIVNYLSEDNLKKIDLTEFTLLEIHKELPKILRKFSILLSLLKDKDSLTEIEKDMFNEFNDEEKKGIFIKVVELKDKPPPSHLKLLDCINFEKNLESFKEMCKIIKEKGLGDAYKMKLFNRGVRKKKFINTFTSYFKEDVYYLYEACLVPYQRIYFNIIKEG